MGWGRVDDTYWEHPKTIALIEQRGLEGLAAAGAYWALNSYCNSKRRGTFTIWEAAMILRRSHDQAAEILAPLLVPPEGFERGFLLRSNPDSASKQGSFLLQSNAEAYVINSFEEYRGKNEAKSRAGAQGGKKSGENRRKKVEAKSKQEPSNDEAGAQQNRSPRSQIPDPITQIPDPRSPRLKAAKQLATSALASDWKPKEITNGTTLQEAVSSWGWALQLRQSEIEECKRIANASPIAPEEITSVLDSMSRSDKPVKYPVPYFLGAIVSAREEAATVAARGPAPARKAPEPEFVPLYLRKPKQVQQP